MPPSTAEPGGGAPRAISHRNDDRTSPARPHRILVVNWQDRENPRGGGAEIHLHEVFGRIASMGHAVTLLCSGWEGCRTRTELDGIDVHRVGTRYTFSLYARRYFRRHLGGRGFDVVVEDLNKIPLFTPRWSDVPVVLLVHHLFGTTAFREANPLLAAATWILERPIPAAFRDTPVIAISESTRADLVRRGLSARRITVVPNGIDLEAYAPVPGEPPFPQPTLLFVGRIKRYKRVDLVLDAMAVLRDRGVDARLIAAGKGDHRAELERRRDGLDLQDRVAFPGFVDEDRKRELLRRSWIHVLTSPKEGWGISNLEAAASGTPTVASDSPGLRDSVVDGETGLLVPHGDVTALADALQRVLEDSPLRRAMGEAARSFAGSFSWDASARTVLEILERHAGAGGVATPPDRAGSAEPAGPERR